MERGKVMMDGCSAFNDNQPGTLCEGLSQLKSEHGPLLEKLDGLYTICSNIDNNENPEENFATLTPAVKTFIAELDPHSEREERVLFRMMENYLGVGVGPVAVMEYEHEQAKSLIKNFLENTEGEQESMPSEKIKENSDLIRSAYFKLVDHFAKEENVLFPMAERMLSDEEKKELFERIQQI
jgi:regulator of cell morphogenesis and NO signaling